MGFYLCSKIIEFARKQNLNHIRSVCRITNAAMKKILNHFSHNMEGSSTYMKQNIASFFLALNGKRFEPQVNHYPTDLMEDSQPKLRN
jgi:hypothetical protein